VELSDAYADGEGSLADLEAADWVQQWVWVSNRSNVRPSRSGIGERAPRQGRRIKSWA